MKKKLVSILLTMLMVFCAAPFVAFAESCDGGTSCTHEAAIGNEHYATLNGALKAANNGDTIIVLKNITLTDYLDYIEKEVTLDLNGKTIEQGASVPESFFIRNGGKLNVTGSGEIKTNANTTAPGLFSVRGNATDDPTKTSSLTIGKDVKVTGMQNENQNLVWVVENPDTKNSSYNVKIDIFGTLNGYETIYVNGNIAATSGNVPEITLHSGAKIKDKSAYGIYLAGYAKTTIEDGVSIEAPNGNAISIAAGELTIDGGTFKSGKTLGYVEGSGGSIDFETCCALFVKQHTTNLPLKVTVNGGTFEAAMPFYQATGQSGTSAAPDKIQLSITDGTFTSTSSESGAAAVKSADKTGFITGGTFSTDPTAYLAEGYQDLENKDGTWSIEPKTLTSIAITVKEPEIGKTPDYDYTWTVKSKDSGDSRVSFWLKIAKDKYDEDSFEGWEVVGEKEKFQKDYYYMFVAGFVPGDGYWMGEEEEMTATINGKEAIVSVVDKSVAYVIKIYGPLTEKATTPATGDNSELGLFAVAGLISAVGVALLLRRKQSM